MASIEELEQQALVADLTRLTPMQGKVDRLTGAGWYTDLRGRQVRVNAYGQVVRAVEAAPRREPTPDPYLFETGGLSQTQKNARAEADAASAAYQEEVAQTAAAHEAYGKAHAPAGTSGKLRQAVHAMLGGGDPFNPDPTSDD